MEKPGTKMNGVLVDASVSAGWFLKDEVNEYSEWILDQMQSEEPVYVPSAWLLEITNLLFNAQRRRRIDRKYRDEALAQIPRLSLTMLAAPTIADLATLSHYSDKHQLTAYDAEYLRLAVERKYILATLDGNLLAAAKREKVQVVGPA
jgi:predicted nucleic acid-binding protein